MHFNSIGKEFLKMKKTIWILVLFLTLSTLDAAPALAPLRVKGDKVYAGSKEIRLRGINWGWFHDANTVYTEEDMANQAEWGANMLRLTIRYTDVANPDGTWNEEKARKVDEVINWAAKYGQYVILDMHELPGGQTPIFYCYGGKMLFWTDKKYQQLTADLWKRIAKRYRSNPAVGAYELMNEPKTQPSNPALCSRMQKELLNAIRSVDPDKAGIITGDFASVYSKSLTDTVKIDDPNVIYTIHYYSGFQGPWLRNCGERKEHLTGTRDWFLSECEFSIPADGSVEEVVMLLRTNKNKGKVWFDDVTMYDENGKIIRHYEFNPGKRELCNFNIERTEAVGKLRYDAAVGHKAPGSLLIENAATSYNGWMNFRWEVEPGKKYKFSAWLKTENATGSSYVAAALFGRPRLYTPDEIYGQLLAAKRFSQKHKVPIYVGEFGIARKKDPKRQAEDVVRRIRAFERAGFHWSYWNYKATDKIEGTEIVVQDRKTSRERFRNLTLIEALKEGWKLNKK